MVDGPIKMWTVLLLCLCAFRVISTLEMVVEKLEREYYNTKYLQYINVTFKKHSRRSPYYLMVDFYANMGFGNNVTFKWVAYENLSGHYVQTPLQFEYKFCDFLYKDPYFGQILSAQLTGNWSCPFPAGRITFKNLEVRTDTLPYIPTTYSSMIVRARCNLDLFVTSTKEPIVNYKAYLKVTQKLKKT